METAEAAVERTRGFIQDLEKAEEIYRRLLKLTKNQSDVLRGGVSPELLDLARAKEEELARLAELETRMGPARSAWSEMKERISAELLSEVQTIVGRVESVLRELIRTEEEEGRNLSRKREETLDQIRKLDSARKVRQAYTGPSSPASLLDQKE